MNDVDRYDFAITMTGGLIAVGIVLLGGPLWVFFPILFAAITIGLYRHFPLPPRRR